jgi:hypothetical protein
MDGHTEAGRPPVELNGIFSVDEVLQAIRSLDWALMMDSHEDKPPDHPQRMDYVAHRAFIKGMRDKLYNALEEQHPDLLKELTS